MARVFGFDKTANTQTQRYERNDNCDERYKTTP
jgi:hypothetical protein